MECELVFFLLTSPKCDFDEVEKAMIEIVEWHIKVIFNFLTNRKGDFFQFDKNDSSGRMALKCHSLSLDKPKILFWRGRESNVSSDSEALGTHFLHLDQAKM